VASNGTSTATFGNVVCDTNRGAAGAEIPAEAMACVIDVHNTITLETFRQSYERIAAAKAVPKAEPALEGDFQPTRVTLGVIFAREADVPIETLAVEMDRLNRQHASSVWPDVVVVLKRGICHYAFQFPGEYDELGGFLPPSDGLTQAIPAYIHIVARPGGPYAFNRLLGILLPHLGTFSTGLNIGIHLDEIVLDAPKTGVTVCAYQFNLAAELRPVPEELYVLGRHFGPQPLEIQAPNGKTVGFLQYIPWQDGAYLRSISIPLEPFLVMLGKPEFLKTIPRKGSVLSYVLPLTPQGFNGLLYKFQKQSNIVVKPPKPPNWTMAKVGDEGAASPFVARLFAGILSIRDRVLEPSQHDSFDKAFQAVRTGIDSVRESAKLIMTAVQEHQAKLASREILSLRGNTLHITENIDKTLNKEIDDFLNTAYRVLKDREQLLLKSLGLDIGFLYQKQATFERGIAALRASHPELAEYLVATRYHWSERLITTRNGLHETWTLDSAKYERNGETVTMMEPQVAGQVISAFVDEMLDRLLCFVEELTMYALRNQLPAVLTLREIPRDERRPEYPERFGSRW
jgi:hypothetical protein